MGCVRSRAWIWLFSSTHSTMARSGGLRYRPTTSLILATSSGSVENLKVWTRWGSEPHSPQQCPDRRGAHPDPEPAELTADPDASPPRVLPRQAEDEIDHLRVDRRASGTLRPAVGPF